jgi:hypothetical protein
MHKFIRKIFFLPVLLILSILSEAAFSQEAKTEGFDSVKSFLRDVKSDPKSNFYISGDFDGYSIYCTSSFPYFYPNDDSAFNTIYIYSILNMDHAKLIRENHDTTIRIGIFFANPHFATRQFPYSLSPKNHSFKENAQIELTNLNKKDLFKKGEIEWDVYFHGGANTSVTVEVTSFRDEILEGTFEGTLSTKNGAKIVVTNGKFKLQMKTINR